MRWNGIKAYLPRGLFGRAAMILVVPIVSIQLLVSVVFIQRHFNSVTEQMTGAVVAELGQLLQLVDAAPTLARARSEIALVVAPLGFEIELPGAAQVKDARRLDDFTGARVIRTLRAGLPALIGADLKSDPERVTLALETRHGPMLVRFARGRLSAPNPHQLLVIMVLFSLLMTMIAVIFMRNQMRPIARLAHAAEAFGKGEMVPYRLAGATEVRAAGRAFLDMRARIERQIEARTLMLSGVSHDLRTPLTRMKLALSMMAEGPERAALEQDVAEMEALVEGFLGFARSEAADDPQDDVDPADLVQRAVDRAHRAGQKVTLGPVDRPGLVRLRPQGLSRALDNLIGNATRYGEHARVSLKASARALHFIVEDDGPGIAPQDREEALKPFSRLDVARNQDLGSGMGLGLTIAAEVARAHGGRLDLHESDELGGLQADLVVPV